MKCLFFLSAYAVKASSTIQILFMKCKESIRHPIIIGIGQVTLRDKMNAEKFSAMDIARQAVNACAKDTRQADILKHLDSISLVHSFSDAFGSPVERLCKAIGICPETREETTVGGNSPQWLVNRAADQIAAGKIKATLLVGSELFYRTIKPDFTIKVHSDTAQRFAFDSNVIGNPRLGYSPYEARYYLDQPAFAYPLFENALRHHLGMSIDEHRRMLKQYFRALAGIAEKNSLAWFNGQGDLLPLDVTKVMDQNRMIGFPYTKLMNPVPFVNQAAALIMTDTATALRLSIPEEKWVYPHGGAEAEDQWYLSDRINYYSSPAIKETVGTSLKMAGVRVSDIDFFDLYSCYPCAVIIAALSIGLPLKEWSKMSITGGLPYFGGPGNNYTMHAIAHAVERIRKKPDQMGLITGNGWFLTKHSAGIYSGRPPKASWKRPPMEVLQHKIDAMDHPVFAREPNGKATIETYTVVHGPKIGERFPVIFARLDSGERCLATALDTQRSIEMFEQAECIGRKGVVEPGNNGLNNFTFTDD